MTKLFRKSVLAVLGGVLAIAPSVSAQTTDESGRTFGPAPIEEPEPRLATNDLVDLVFTPVTPCRIIDTRLVGGPIGGGTTRNFAVSGAAGFAAQGGNPAGCGIPLSASAALINYVAVGPAGPGNLRATAFGTPVPLASIINYSNVPGLNIANGVATPLSAGAAPHITVQADVSATDLVADVLGYYNDVSCQAGTVKALGQCFETALRAADNVFNASETCSTVGLPGRGRLGVGLQLRALNILGILALAAPPGEWTDTLYVDTGGAGFSAMTIASTNGFAVQGTLSLRQYRCVFNPLP